MADISSSQARKLPFPLGNAITITGSTDGQEISFPIVDVFPLDPDEPIAIKIELSLNEYVALASAVDVGRDIAFGMDTVIIWELWTRIFKGLAMSCEDIADCIETNETTQDAIAIAITNNTNIQNSTIEVVGGLGNPNRINGSLTKIADRNPSGFESEQVATLAGCDLDELWAGIRHGIVERLDENLQDTLQDISAIPTVIGRNAAWLDIVPVLGDIAEATVTTLSSVVPTLLSLFESYSSEATKDELACELFAFGCADCRYPTFQEVYDHFKNYGLQSTPSIADWTLQVMTDLLTDPVGVLSKVAYFTLMTWQLGILWLGAKLNVGQGTNQLSKWASLGADFANNNWEQLCDSCDEGYRKWTIDFTKTKGETYFAEGFTTTVGGTWIAGQGWRFDNVSNGGQVLQFAVPQDTTWRVKAIGFKMNVQPTVAIGQTNQFRPNPRSATGSVAFAMNNCTGTIDEYRRYANRATLQAPGQEIAFRWTYGDQAEVRYVTGMQIIYENVNSPADAEPTAQYEYCV